jgi:fluoride exporter
MIEKVLAVALGGSIGAILRYLIFIFFQRTHNQSFPWSTLLINLAGSFLIGFLWGFFDKIYVSPGVRLFLFVGILGSFTTFSTFAFDVFSLGRDGSIKYMFLYIFATNIFGIALAYGGYYLSKIN